eukprot:m.93701 g.93701  ORF g.93701 m.93701 type:complete len:187 (+) comp12167_c0_seq3:58-618(+)
MFCGWLRFVGGTCASAAIGGALLGVTRRSARTESDNSGAPEVAIDTQTPKRDEVPQSAANATATNVEQQPKSRRLRLIKREYLTSLTRLPDRFGEAQAVDLPQNAWEYVDVLDVTELDAKSVPKEVAQLRTQRIDLTMQPVAYVLHCNGRGRHMSFKIVAMESVPGFRACRKNISEIFAANTASSF